MVISAVVFCLKVAVATQVISAVDLRQTKEASAKAQHLVRLEPFDRGIGKGAFFWR